MRLFGISIVLVGALIAIVFGFIAPARAAEIGVWILLFLTLAAGAFGLWAAKRGR